MSRPIAVSAVVHAIIIAIFFAVPGVLFRFHEKPTRIVWVELPRGPSEEIELGLKRAETLPRTTIEEQRRLDPSQEPLPATKPDEARTAKIDIKTELEPRPEMKIEKERVRRAEPPRPTRTDRRIQDALAKIDRQIQDRTVVPEAAQVKEEGVGFRYGTGDRPLKVMPSDPEYLKYQAMLRHRIMREWIVPMRLTEEGAEPLNARIEVMINLDGDVISVRWQSQSGNAAFDQSAVRAIKRASPFPKPPDRLAWEAYNEGFLIEFDPRLKAKY